MTIVLTNEQLAQVSYIYFCAHASLTSYAPFFYSLIETGNFHRLKKKMHKLYPNLCLIVASLFPTSLQLIKPIN